MPNLQASPRSDLLGFIADKLKAGKSFGNKYEILKQIPLLGGTGLGDLFLGNSPELSDDMSYNLSSVIRGGNRATGGLGTYTLDKRSADLGMTLADALGIGTGIAKLGRKGLNTLLNKSGFDATRRAFLEGKASGLNQPTNEAITSTLSTGNDILQTPVSRRNVLKGAALAGGAVVAPSLLRNFSKEVEHTVPKVAEHSIDNIVNSGIKHKYNTLAEYFDDVTKSSSKYYQDDLDNFEVTLSPKEMDDLYKSHFTERLKQDESTYKLHKSNAKSYNNPERSLNNLQTKLRDRANIYLEENSFSPQAKQEMAEYKNHANSYWSNEALGNDSWTQPRNFEDWLNGDRIPF